MSSSNLRASSSCIRRIPFLQEGSGKWVGLSQCNFARPGHEKLASTKLRLCLAAVAGRDAQEASSTTDLIATTGIAETFPAAAAAGSWRLTDQHMVVLGVMASVIMGALCCIFVAAIPTLLAIKKAAEAMEKLANTTRDELPGTMAAVRLSGMEISDLTMELSDLGQEITAGVRRSTRAVRAAEDGLRRASSIASAAIWQAQANGVAPAQSMGQPMVAQQARSLRLMIARARTIVKNLITLGQISSWLGKRTRNTAR